MKAKIEFNITDCISECPFCHNQFIQGTESSPKYEAYCTFQHYMKLIELKEGVPDWCPMTTTEKY